MSPTRAKAAGCCSCSLDIWTSCSASWRTRSNTVFRSETARLSCVANVLSSGVVPGDCTTPGAVLRVLQVRPGLYGRAGDEDAPHAGVGPEAEGCAVQRAVRRIGAVRVEARRIGAEHARVLV